MDPVAVTLAALASLAVMTTAGWLLAHRTHRRTRRHVARLGEDLADARRAQAELIVGEREAAWSASAAARRVERLSTEIAKSAHELRRLSADIEDLRERVARRERTSRGLTAERDAAAARIAVLEAQLSLAASQAEADRVRLQELDGMRLRLATVVRERDRLSAAAQRSEQLEAELAALGRVHQDLADARREADALRERLAMAVLPGELDELEAELEELRAAVDAAPNPTEVDRLRATIAGHEDTIAALTHPHPDDDQDHSPTPPAYADWDALLRRRITVSVDQATTRLRSEVEHLRLVVREKERLLHDRPQAAPPSDPAQLEVTTIKGIGPVIARILAAHGFDTVGDIATLTETDIDRLGAEMPVYPGRIRSDDWVGQAQALIR